MPGTLQVISPLFYYLHDGQQFVIVSVIVFLGWGELSVVEIDWSEDSESIELIENARNNKAICIHLGNNWIGQVKVLQNWCIRKGSLEFPECQLRFSCPWPLGYEYL
jgi:hypothetical protein